MEVYFNSFKLSIDFLLLAVKRRRRTTKPFPACLPHSTLLCSPSTLVLSFFRSHLERTKERKSQRTREGDKGNNEKETLVTMKARISRHPEYLMFVEGLQLKDATLRNSLFSIIIDTRICSWLPSLVLCSVFYALLFLVPDDVIDCSKNSFLSKEEIEDGLLVSYVMKSSGRCKERKKFNYFL